MNLKEYTDLLEILEKDVKKDDAVTAYNLVKELSVIYLKLNYERLSSEQKTRQKDRLLSMVDYIITAIPKHAEKLSIIILDSVESEN